MPWICTRTLTPDCNHAAAAYRREELHIDQRNMGRAALQFRKELPGSAAARQPVLEIGGQAGHLVEDVDTYSDCSSGLNTTPLGLGTSLSRRPPISISMS